MGETLPVLCMHSWLEVGVSASEDVSHAVPLASHVNHFLSLGGRWEALHLARPLDFASTARRRGPGSPPRGMYMCVCECLWYIFRPLGLWPTSLEVPCSFCSSLELLAVTMFSCWRTCCSNLPVTTCVIVCPVYDLFFCMKVFQVAVSKGLVDSDARGLRISGAPSEVP
jgi:hypothetical protein